MCDGGQVAHISLELRLWKQLCGTAEPVGLTCFTPILPALQGKQVASKV